MLLRLAAFFLLSLLALAGCSATSSLNTSEESATETQTLRDTLVAPTATITANQVTLTTDRSTYAPRDTVRVTIANGRGVRIYAVAPKASCTALDVQVKNASGWQAYGVALCAPQTVPDMLEIKPRGATTVTIPAPAGTYRCALQYTTVNIPPPRNAPSDASVSASNSTSGPATTVYSAPWEVKSA